MWPRVWLTWTDGQQATSADRLWAGIEGSGCGGQAKIAMSRQLPGLRERTVGWASNPAADGVMACNSKSMRYRRMLYPKLH